MKSEQNTLKYFTMKTTKKIGICMDQSNAKLIEMAIETVKIGTRKQQNIY